MSRIVVIGGGLCGSLSAMLLVKEGHDVVVLDRDDATPPDNPIDAWDNWQRRSVRQFHMGHFFLPRFRQELLRELPEVIEAMRAAGCLEQNFFDGMPEELTGGRRDGDDRFTLITGRRPVVEAVVANQLAATDATVRRGVVVKRLLTDPVRHPPHVIGVESATGERFDADLVVDASGRSSSLPAMLAEIGATSVDEADDSGYVYYGRTFTSPDGSVPAALSGGLVYHESISTLTLAADNGTWFCGLVAAASDKELRRLRDPDVFERVWRSYLLTAHWHDGEPIDGGPKVMAGLEDRIRHFADHDGPIATGIAVIGDAWACTNPSVGRGASMALVHAVALRDHLREADLDDAAAFTSSWHARTEATVRPWYDDTLMSDHDRLAQMQAEINATEHVTDNPILQAFDALRAAMMTDADLLRAYFDMFMLFRTKRDVFADQELLDRLLAAGPPPKAEGLGPTRAELLALIG